MTSDQLLWVGFQALMRARRVVGDPVSRLMAPAARANPYPEYERVRARGRLVTALPGVVTSEHALTSEVLRDPVRFASNPDNRKRPFKPRPVDLAGAPDPMGQDSIISKNPPEHDRLRRVVGRAFTRRAVERLRPLIERTAAELLDELDTDAGPVDLIETYAAILPVRVISQLLGVPSADQHQIQRWGDDLAVGLDLASPALTHRSEQARADLYAYLGPVFAGRREGSGELVIDSLLAAEGAGAITNRELMATAMLLLAAGFETTVNLIGNGALALLRHPDQAARLRREPDLTANAVEEMLRWDPPIQVEGRTVAADTELAGRRLRRDSSVIMYLGGANRDPAVFDDPAAFDVGRANASSHLSFAAGPHYCVGAALARLEAEVAFTALLDRFLRWRLVGEPTRRPGFTLRGFSRLPVELSRARIPA